MFLSRLLARTLGESAALAPRRASRFEGSEGGFEERFEEKVAPVAPRRDVAPAAADISGEVPSANPAAPADPSPPLRPPSASVEGERQPQPVREIHEVHTVEQRLTALPPETPAPPSARAPDPPPPQPAEPRRPAARPTDVPREQSTLAAGEIRIERHSMEHRFETLVREHTIERTPDQPRPEQRPSSRSPTEREPPPARPAAPQRTTAAVTPPPPSRRAALAERAAPAPPPTPPVVHVTIGRVEVRAVQSQPPKPTAKPREPRMGLDDYLARRERA